MEERCPRVEKEMQYIDFNLCLNTCRASRTQINKLPQIRIYSPEETTLFTTLALERVKAPSRMPNLCAVETFHFLMHESRGLSFFVFEILIDMEIRHDSLTFF